MIVYARFCWCSAALAAVPSAPASCCCCCCCWCCLRVRPSWCCPCVATLQTSVFCAFWSEALAAGIAALPATVGLAAPNAAAFWAACCLWPAPAWVFSACWSCCCCLFALLHVVWMNFVLWLFICYKLNNMPTHKSGSGSWLSVFPCVFSSNSWMLFNLLTTSISWLN